MKKRQDEKQTKRVEWQTRQSVQTQREIQPDTARSNTLMTQQSKNEDAVRFLEEWLADESGYDEETWPIVKKAIEENRPSCRRRFHS